MVEHIFEEESIIDVGYSVINSVGECSIKCEGSTLGKSFYL